MNLFEVLISLAVLSVVAAIAVGGRGGQNPKLDLQRRVSEIQTEAVQHRQRAVAAQGTTELSVIDAGCMEGEADVELTFFADGTGNGGPLCIDVAGVEVQLVLDLFTGRLVKVDP